jgi:hypothetical protein
VVQTLDVVLFVALVLSAAGAATVAGRSTKWWTESAQQQLHTDITQGGCARTHVQALFFRAPPAVAAILLFVFDGLLQMQVVSNHRWSLVAMVGLFLAMEHPARPTIFVRELCLLAVSAG